MPPPQHHARSRTIASLLSLCLLLLSHIHTTSANFSPYPTALWTGLNPTTVTYNHHTQLLYTTTYTTILATTPTDLTTVLANATLTTTLVGSATDAPVSCGGYLHYTANDGEAGHAWLWSYNATTLELVWWYELDYQLAVMACAGGGEVVLTGRQSETMVVAMRAVDGKRLATWQLDGMHLRGVAVSEANGLLYALDDSYNNYSVQVFSYTNGTHLHTFPLSPHNVAAVFTIAIDPTSTYLYLQAVLAQSSDSVLLQLRTADGRLQSLTLAYGQYEPNDGLAVLSAERLLLGDHLSFALLDVDFAVRGGNVTRRLVGPRPLLTSVTALAVDGVSGDLYVASKWPAQVLQLDGVGGRLIGMYDVNDGAACGDRRQVAVAVDGKRQVYATLCDGRIGVYDQQQQLVDYILPYNYSSKTMISAMFISRNTSQLYYTDYAFPTMIFRYDLASHNVAQVWSNASAIYECFAVDERDQTMYAANNYLNNPTLDHYAANGTLLSSIQLVEGIVSIVSLAVSYIDNKLLASLFYADSDVIAIDLVTGNVGPSFSWSDGSVAGVVCVDERTGRVYVMDEDSGGVLLFDGDGMPNGGVVGGGSGSAGGRRHSSGRRRRVGTELSR